MIKNYPENGQFQYDIFASKASPGLGGTLFRISKNFHTYVVLKKDNSGSRLEAKLPDFARKYAGPQLRELLGAFYGDLLKGGNIYEFRMQPLTVIHLNSHPDYEREPNGDIKYIYIFSIISVFLLLKACINFMNLSTDYDFVQTMNLYPADGRYFSRDYPSDSLTIVLNETAVKLMGIKDQAGKRLILPGCTTETNVPYNLVGVLNDFNFESLHENIRPLAIVLNRGLTAYLPGRIKAADVAGSVSFIGSKWKKFVPGKPSGYFFLNDYFNKLYKTEQKTGQIFTVFSVLAIFIVCFGLFGLAAFTAERRTQGTVTRKVPGTSITGIVILLSKKFTKWALVANLIAWPLAIYFINGRLENFACRITPGPFIFLYSAGSTLFIALVTVSFQAVKVAVANPVNALISEQRTNIELIFYLR